MPWFRSGTPRAAPEASTSLAESAARITLGEQVFIAVGVVWLLIGPRIAVPGAFGIRVEDVVVAALAVLVLARMRDWRSLGLPAVAVVAVAAAGLLSVGVAAVLGRVSPVSGTLFALRPLEYAFVYPAIVLLLAGGGRGWTRRVDIGLGAVTVVQSAVAVAQVFLHIEIGFSHQSYERGAGLTAGPYELGAISAALLVYWFQGRRPVLSVIALIGLLVSVSRVSLIGALLGLAILGVAAARRVVRARRRSRRERVSGARRQPAAIAGVVSVLVVLTVAAASVVIMFGSPGGSALEPVTSRFQSTSVLGSWKQAEPIAAGIAPIPTAEKWNHVAYDQIFLHVDAPAIAAAGGDPSAVIRFFRWHLILDTVDTVDELVLGLGPSFVGSSVDGSYVRFFADGGLLGVAVWVLLLSSWFRRVPAWMRAVAATYLVGGVFIDIVYAMRPMVLLWLLLGLAVAGSRSRHRGPGVIRLWIAARQRVASPGWAEPGAGPAIDPPGSATARRFGDEGSGPDAEGAAPPPGQRAPARIQ